MTESDKNFPRTEHEGTGKPDPRISQIFVNSQVNSILLSLQLGIIREAVRRVRFARVDDGVGGWQFVVHWLPKPATSQVPQQETLTA